MSHDDDIATFYYQIDASDRLESVDAEWVSFAEENRGESLTADNVAGVSIWDYISGYEVRHLYEMMFQAVRSKQRKVNVPFRCDSPTIRRFMELEIEPAESGSLRLKGALVREEPRKYSDLLGASERDPEQLLSICSWCKRVDVGDDEWVEVEEAVRVLELFGENLLPGLSHGMCLDCHSRVEEELESL